MGTVIYNKHGLQVKRFYGGIDRGVCYQITVSQNYTVFKTKEFIRFLLDLILFHIDEAEEEEEE